MDKAMYIASTGASQNMAAQRIHANNMANVNTTGFRADFEQARSMPVYGETYPTRAYALTENPGTKFDSGPMQETGRKLDVAINGDGWIAVQNAQGQEAYTRAGNVRVDSNGFLTTGSGLPVLGDGGPIVLPEYESLDIGKDGTISVRAAGDTAVAIADVDRLKLVNPSLKEMTKGEDGLMYMRDGSEAEADPLVTVENGFLEGSNVNVVEGLVNMISLSRQFEMHIKMISTAEENAKAMERVLQLG